MNAITTSRLMLLMLAISSAPSLAQLNGERVSSTRLTPLMMAARANDLAKMRILLAHGVSVNERAREGETALYEAIERLDPRHDNLPTVNLLLQAGADPNEVSIFNATPLVLSLTRDHINPAVTLSLLHAGAVVPHDCKGDDGVVSLATQDSSVEVMTALLSAGASPNCQDDPYGMTALHWAAINGQDDRVQTLLKGGANPALRNKDGKTPFDLASTTNPNAKVKERFARTRALLESAKAGQ